MRAFLRGSGIRLRGPSARAYVWLVDLPQNMQHAIHAPPTKPARARKPKPSYLDWLTNLSHRVLVEKSHNLGGDRALVDRCTVEAKRLRELILGRFDRARMSLKRERRSRTTRRASFFVD